MAATGILLVNLGSPEAPTPEALRPFLREFLSDPRVIPGAAWKRWLLVNLIVLPFRPRLSAARYARVWDEKTGMPLIHWTRRLGEALAPLVADLGPVGVGMRYGKPPLAEAATDLLRRGADRLLVVPLFPQTSGATTGAVEDAVQAFVRPLGRDLPVRLLPAYHPDPGYLDAVAASVREDLGRLGWEPERLLVSFHGIPRSMADAGDSYPRQVEETVEALRGRLPLPRDRVLLVWQSRFGPAEWLQPYCLETLVSLARSGVRRAVVVTPGFAADCLETMDEIGRENREAFLGAGGTHFHRVPCLNDRGDWVRALAAIVRGDLAR